MNFARFLPAIFGTAALAAYLMPAGITAAPEPAVFPEETWLPLDDPEAAGWSPEKLAGARAYAEQIQTAAYMLVIGGRVVASYGDLGHNYRCHSVRKSLLSALYGIAIEREEVDPAETIAALGIGDFTPLTETEKTATVADLMASRSGIYLPATFENRAVDAVRPKRGSNRPGERWFYSNWDFNTLGTIYQQKTGCSICRSFKEQIAEPIGMHDFSFENCRWRYSARSRHPAYAFRLSTRDLARFGYLFLHRGRWRDKQVVPRQWVAESTRFRSNVVRPDGTPLPGVGYALMWWTARDGRHHLGSADVDVGPGAFSASGTGTQLLLVAPALDLVFVHRTDTDLPSSEFRAISNNEIGELFKRLIAAKKL